MVLLALGALSVPLAQAQVGSFTLAASPDSATVHPGDHAAFNLTATNTGLLPRTAQLRVANLSDGWNATLTPDNFTVAANGNATATLDVATPANATLNTTYTLVVEARDATGVLATATVNVTLVPTPPAPQENATTTSAPDLRLAIAGSSGQPGQTVQGTLTLTNAGATGSLDVRLAIQGLASWSPGFPGGLTFYRVGANSLQTAPVQVTIPADAGNETQRFTLLATLDGTATRYTVAWDVTSIAPNGPAATTSSAGGSTSQGGSAVATTPTPADAQPRLALALVSAVDALYPGAPSQGVVQVANAGNTVVTVRYAANAGDGWTTRVSPAEATLQPGASQTVTVLVQAPRDLAVGAKEGHALGTFTATTTDGLSRTLSLDLVIPPLAGSTTTQGQQAAPPPAPAPDASLPSNTATLAAAAGLAAVGTGALMLLHRPTREKLLWVAVGLYTRLARPDVLGHEERERLHKIIEQQPGVHFHALQRELGWNTGTLTYHLRVLEKHGFVVDRRDGLYRRFYLSGAAPRKETFENAGPQGLRGDVLEAVRGRHGLSQTDLALALGANKQTVNYHVKALERQGLIRLEKRGRETFLYPAGVASTAPGEAQA